MNNSSLYRTVILTGETIEYIQEPIGIEYTKSPAPPDRPDKYVLEGKMTLTFWTDRGWQPLYLMSGALCDKIDLDILENLVPHKNDVDLRKAVIERNIWRCLEKIMKAGEITIHKGMKEERTMKFYAVAKYAIIFKEGIR